MRENSCGWCRPNVPTGVCRRLRNLKGCVSKNVCIYLNFGWNIDELFKMRDTLGAESSYLLSRRQQACSLLQQGKLRYSAWKYRPKIPLASPNWSERSLFWHSSGGSISSILEILVQTICLPEHPLELLLACLLGFPVKEANFLNLQAIPVLYYLSQWSPFALFGDSSTRLLNLMERRSRQRVPCWCSYLESLSGVAGMRTKFLFASM